MIVLISQFEYIYQNIIKNKHYINILMIKPNTIFRLYIKDDMQKCVEV